MKKQKEQEYAHLRKPEHATEIQQSHESNCKVVKYNSRVVPITGATVTINEFTVSHNFFLNIRNIVRNAIM